MTYDIFISYRRQGGYATAKHLYDLLTRDGYNVSFDIDTLRNGDFDTELLKRIDECTDFILILNDTAFDRCIDPNFDRKHDWLRNELAYALEKGKNIIPIMLAGFTEFPDNLPADIARVTRKNGPKYDEYYFDDFYHRLKTRFLDTPTPTQVSHNEPNAQPANANAGALLRVLPDMECRIEKFGENLGIAAAGQYFPLRLRKGKHILKFVSTHDERDSITITQIVEDAEMEDFIEVALMPIKEARIGGTYVGETRNGLRWGKGKHIYPDGTIYEGEWENDKRKGKGVFTYADGRCYEGEFVDGSFCIYINPKNFPDYYFRNYLLEQDFGKDGILRKEAIKRITSIDVHEKKIKNLKGIELFTKLKILDCSKNELRVLDISKLPKLTHLDCGDNGLTALDVSKNIGLIYLDCHYNRLTALDVSKNIGLTYLDCSDNGFNGLTALDVSKNIGLTYLDCSDNGLTALDVSKNIGLTYLDCSDNGLTALDVSKNIELTHLDCGRNKLTALDISKQPKLTYLDCGGNELPALDVSKNIELTHLECQGNGLPALDVSKNIELTHLECQGNGLPALDVSKNIELTHLECYHNQLTALDVSKNIGLTFVNCNDNQLTELDVSKNIKLTILSCLRNKLTTLNLSENIGLTFVNCEDNQLTALDVRNNTELTKLYCYNNKIKTLDLSKNKKLTEIKK